MSDDLKPAEMTIGVYTSNVAINEEIINQLSPKLSGYRIKFVPFDKDPDIIITLPEFILLFEANVPLFVLTDDITVLTNNDTVVEVSPFPLSPDDQERASWRLIKALEDIYYGM